jgi:hypothetical protein
VSIITSIVSDNIKFAVKSENLLSGDRNDPKTLKVIHPDIGRKITAIKGKVYKVI